MNFFLDNNIIGLQVNTWCGFLILLWFGLEVLFLITHKMLLIHKLLIFPHFYYQVYRILPRYWKVRNHLWFLAAYRKSFNRFEVYIELLSHFEIDEQTCHMQMHDVVSFNLFGKIIETEISKKVEKLNISFKDSIKKYNRQQNLDDLGI